MRRTTISLIVLITMGLLVLGEGQPLHAGQESEAEHLTSEERAERERQQRIHEAQRRLREAEQRQHQADSELPERVDGPSYFVIPIQGIFGMHVRWQEIRQSLQAAERSQPDVVILTLDSPGGSTAELDQITDGLMRWRRDHPEIDVVALVEREAISAAAVIAMVCTDIYMKPNSIIGATAVSSVGGIPPKFLSTMRARDRMIARSAGHDVRIPRAMEDKSESLWAVFDDEGAVRRLATSEPAHHEEARKLVGRGELLTLTAGEAVQIEFATAIVDGFRELAQGRGNGYWEEVSGVGRRLMSRHRIEVERALEDIQRRSRLITETLRLEFSGNKRQLVQKKSRHEQSKRHLARIGRLVDRYEWGDPVSRYRLDAELFEVERLLDARIRRLEAQIERASPTHTRPRLWIDD